MRPLWALVLCVAVSLGASPLSTCTGRREGVPAAVAVPQRGLPTADAISTFADLRKEVTGRETVPVPESLSAVVEEWVQKQNSGSHTCAVWVTCTVCNGIGDQLRGLRSAFYFAVITDCSIYISRPEPVNSTILAFLEPNRVDWTWPMPSRGFTADKVQHTLKTLSVLDLAKAHAALSTGNVVRWKSFDWAPKMLFEFFNTHTHGALAPIRDAFAPPQLALDTLFRPRQAFLTDYLLPTLADSPVFSTTDKPRMCIHIRTGRSDRYKFDEGNLGKVSHGSITCLACLHEELSGGEEAMNVLVASDSSPTKLGLPASPSYTYSALSTPASRAHIAKGATPDGVMVMGVEWVALAMCDVLVHSRSGFSHVAAQWGGIPIPNVRVFPRLLPWEPLTDTANTCPSDAYWPHYNEMYMP